MQRRIEVTVNFVEKDLEKKILAFKNDKGVLIEEYPILYQK